jgi:hypothetical protein
MKMIPITVASDSSCQEHSGDVPKLNLPLTRRHLLKGTGILMGKLTAGSAVALLAPSPVWAVELKTLSQPEGEALMAMGRVLYPHKKLPDAVYALLAKDLDVAAGTDAAQAKQLRDGIASLNSASGGDFAKADDATKLKAVKAMEKQPFFGMVRGKCVTALYDNDMAYTAFGYPGSAWEKGGYITRGFQDLKWLPEPSKAASPKVWMG